MTKKSPTQEELDSRRQVRMSRIDAMSEPMRLLVHEYGLTVVDAFLHAGVTKPRHIKHCIETVLRENCPWREGGSSQGHQPSKNQLDPYDHIGL